MYTKRLSGRKEDIDKAAAIIRAGGLVAFPTETVYGLGADARNEKAVEKIYHAKGRPVDNPMIVHIARASDLGKLTSKLSPDIVKLIEHFWPGPLTIVLKKKQQVPDRTTGGLDTVAIRMPDHPTALELISRSGCPIAAPSANLSGSPSPTRTEHVVKDLNGKINAIIAGDPCSVGIESTVLDLSLEIPTILRPGIITKEDIQAVIEKDVKMDRTLVSEYTGADQGIQPKSPGMKYQHYAPKAEMVIIQGQREKVKTEINRLKTMNQRLQRKVGVILFEEKDFVRAAHEFFARLREMDDQDVDLILAGALSDTDGIGFAVMNRMLKAAGYHIVKV